MQKKKGSVSLAMDAHHISDLKNISLEEDPDTKGHRVWGLVT